MDVDDLKMNFLILSILNSQWLFTKASATKGLLKVTLHTALRISGYQLDIINLCVHSKLQDSKL